MEVQGPFPELDNHEFKFVELGNGLRALLISSEKKDSAFKLANVEERKALAKLLRDVNGASVTKDTLKQRRSTLITENGSLRNLLRTSQRTLLTPRKSDLDEESYSPVVTQRKSRISQRLNGDDAPLSRKSRLSQKHDEMSTSFRSRISEKLEKVEESPTTVKTRVSQRFNEDNVKPLRTSARFAGIAQADASLVNENKRTSRRLEEHPDEDQDDTVSVKSVASYHTLPGNTTFRKTKSHRMSSAISGLFQNAQASAVLEGDLPVITDVAAAAVCVSVGSLSDPADCQGLAHVVEHMIFMGTERFAAENEWDTFISKSGGDSNATTEAERTTFHFSVPQESFEDALVRFSRFFHDPLLRKESLQRELAAIDSEFSDSAGEVSFRLAEIACATARTGPFSQFACGNSKTLKSNSNLHANMVRFFESHYVAPNITVVLYSSDSLSILEEQCRKYFQTIPAVRIRDDKNGSEASGPLVPLSKFVASAPPFRALDEHNNIVPSLTMDDKAQPQPGVDGFTLGCVIVCDPEGTQPHTLQLSWQLPCQRGNWSSKPLKYISHLLSSEAEGGIAAEFKQREWANGLFASDGTYASGIEGSSAATLFSIYILLTDAGLLHWESVVSCIFEYLGMLSREGVQEWVFEELKRCLEIQYVFKDDSSDIGSFVETLSRRFCTSVSQLPPERVCNGEDLIFSFDPEAIHNVLRMLVPETCRIDIISRASGLSTAASGAASNPNKRGGGEEFTTSVAGLTDWMFRKPLRKRVFETLLKDAVVRTEPWYQTKFCAVATPKKLMSKWRNAMKGTKSFAHLPKKNPYSVANPIVAEKLLSASKFTSSSSSSPSLSATEKRARIRLPGGREGRIEDIQDEFSLIYVTRAEFQDRLWTRSSSLQYLDQPSPSSSSSVSFEETPGGQPNVQGADRQRPGRLLIDGDDENAKRFHMWVLQRGAFRTTRVTFISWFKFAPAKLTALESALLDLFVVCLNDAMATERYNAGMAGTVMEMIPRGRGIWFYASGLEDAVQLLVEKTMEVFLECGRTGLKSLSNLSLESQLEVTFTKLSNDDCSLKETLDGVLRLDQHHPLNKLNALEQATHIKTRLDAFLKDKISTCCGVALYQGQVRVAKAFALLERISQMLPVASSPTLSTPAVTAQASPFRLPSHANSVDLSTVSSTSTQATKMMTMMMATANPMFSQRSQAESGPTRWHEFFAMESVLDVQSKPKKRTLTESSLPGMTSVFVAPIPSSSVLVYFQLHYTNSLSVQGAAGPVETDVSSSVLNRRKQARVMSQLLSQLIKEPLFNTVRTKWQIAYHAHASPHICDGTLGMAIEMSSSNAGTVEMAEIVDEFLVMFYENVLKPMTLMDFNRHLRALELRKLEKDRGPSEETKRHFETIVHGLQTGVFDWNADSNEVAMVNELTKDQVVDFFMRHLHPDGEDRKTLTLLIVGEEEMLLSTKLSRQGETNHRSMRLVQSTDSQPGIVREEDENMIKDTNDTTTISIAKSNGEDLLALPALETTRVSPYGSLAKGFLNWLPSIKSIK